MGGVTDPPPMYLGEDDGIAWLCCCCWYFGEIEYLGEVVGVLDDEPLGVEDPPDGV